MPDQTDQRRADEFLIAFAEAILTWQRVERNLFFILIAVYDGENKDEISRAFYNLRSIPPRLNLVDKWMGQSNTSTSVLKKWNALRARIKDQADWRHKLAHLSLQGTATLGKDGQTFQLAPHFTDTTRSIEDECDLAKIREIRLVFDALVMEVWGFFLVVHPIGKANPL
jgi:hypothetical protein